MCQVIQQLNLAAGSLFPSFCCKWPYVKRLSQMLLTLTQSKTLFITLNILIFPKFDHRPLSLLVWHTLSEMIIDIWQPKANWIVQLKLIFAIFR